MQIYGRYYTFSGAGAHTFFLRFVFFPIVRRGKRVICITKQKRVFRVRRGPPPRVRFMHGARARIAYTGWDAARRACRSRANFWLVRSYDVSPAVRERAVPTTPARRLLIVVSIIIIIIIIISCLFVFLFCPPGILRREGREKGYIYHRDAVCTTEYYCRRATLN